MVQTAKSQPRRLTPSPKALQKALEQSARQAQRLADAFGVVVPSIKPKTTGSARNPERATPVKTSYDPATDSLYIHLADRAAVDSDEVIEGIVLDYDINGVLVGIDVQHAAIGRLANG